MSSGAITMVARPARAAARALDYVRLTKPRIALLVLATVAVSAHVARWGWVDGWTLLCTLIGTALVAASGSALNQWLERGRDARMARTANRPLPAGRLTSNQVLVMAAVTVTAGAALLLVVGWRPAFWALVSWTLYAWVYTPLKARTPLNTAVGAVAGALPVLIGWSATGTALDLQAACLFTVLYLWQFPHFMAIAWIYRDQYRRGGMRMLTVVDPSGGQAAAQAVLASLLLLPVSFLPGLLVPGAQFYLVAVFVLGLAQLACAVHFLLRLDHGAARLLLRASLVYLPALLALWISIPLV